MLSERDVEQIIRRVREQREDSKRQDTLILMNSWRAIARSHRALDRSIYVPKDGELHVVKDRARRHAS
jgi:hypothetical protein